MPGATGSPLPMPTMPGGAPAAPAALMQPAVAAPPALGSGGDSAKQAELQQELDVAKAALSEKNTELKQLSKELTKKVHETTQYQNLKKMMMKKTQEMKKYKDELKKHDPSFGGSDD